jgi:hypothetical protein
MPRPRPTPFHHHHRRLGPPPWHGSFFPAWHRPRRWWLLLLPLQLPLLLLLLVLSDRSVPSLGKTDQRVGTRFVSAWYLHVCIARGCC